MTIKTILVPLSGGLADSVALAAGFEVARRFSAHVCGLCVRPDPRDAVPMLGEGVSGELIEEIMQAADVEAGRQAELARGHFERAVAVAGVTVADRPGAANAVTASWREAVGRADDVVTRAGRVHDLLLFAESRAELAPGRADLTLEMALLASARPLLVVPAEPPTAIGSTIAIAWDGGAESTHAVAGALPFLAAAGRARILTATSSRPEDATAEELATYLGWHGIVAETNRIEPAGRVVGEALLEHAMAAGADLLVLGGYGHSRLREMILGGVTRYVLTHLRLPVLLAH
jgi:nucleotide-binding universal stress UspA family protein